MGRVWATGPILLVVVTSACGASSTPPVPSPAATTTVATTTAAPSAQPAPLPTVPPTPSPAPTPLAELVFTADPGVRIEGGIPTAVVEGAATYLYFNGDTRLATSTDGLTFGPARSVEPTRERRLALRLADGTYRIHASAGRNCCGLKSFLSKDGVAFAEESGLRYVLHTSDNGTLGVFDLWADAGGGVVLLYIGDLRGVNNIRRAYAKDGRTFAFEDGNPLGDAQAGGGARSFVDQSSIALPDGRRRVFVMRMGTIYSFVTADGKTFTQEPGARLRPEDYTERSIRSLHDPSVVRLADGRYRMYVGAFDTSGKELILSATTR